jgi:hypothetical protein
MGQYDHILEDARQLAKAGKQKEAHQKINTILMKNPDEKRALWYMATVTPSSREKYEALLRLTQVYPEFQPGWDMYNQVMRDAALRSQISNEEMPIWAKKIHGVQIKGERAPWWGWAVAIGVYIVFTIVQFVVLEIWMQQNMPGFKLMGALRTQLLIVSVPGLLFGFFQTLRVTADKTKSVGMRVLLCIGVFILSGIIVTATSCVMQLLFGLSAINAVIQ